MLYKETLVSWNKEILTYVIAGMINLIMVRFFFKRDFPETGKGVLVSTFIAALALLLFTEIRLN